MRIVGSRTRGALLRAVLVAWAVLLPQLLLGPGADGGGQLALLAALLAALFVFSEYATVAPSFLEFRDAPPYNRFRMTTLVASLVLACAMLRPDWTTSQAGLPFRWLGATWSDLLDGPWSPVRVLLGTLPSTAAPLAPAIRDVAAAVYGLSLLMVLAFAGAVRLGGWPGRPAFNVWVNLPRFAPSAGGDVVTRLQQGALVNLVLGLLLPLIAPRLADLLALPFPGGQLRDPAALAWVVVAWAFLPASLAMRGLALLCLAGLIEEHRARLEGAQAA